MIGVAVGTLSNFVYPGVLEALADGLRARGYRILLFTAPSHEDADPELAQIMRYQVDGVVLAATTLSSALAEECRAAGVPVLLFNRTGASRAVSSVTADNREGGRVIAGLLAAAGHRRCAFLAGAANASTSREREEGFVEGLRGHGLSLFARAEGGYDSARAAEATAALLAKRKRPDALFCASDHMAVAAIDVARAAGLRVPEDLSIVGFDDAPPAAWPPYRLTTYALPVAAMVGAAIDLLMGALADPATPPRQVVVPGHLVLRSSCRLPETC
jgi:LacI family transcriptional regulator